MKNEDRSTVGGRIRFLRQAKGWKQTTFAEKVGASQAAISQWENNHFLPGDFWRWRIADVLGISEEWLFGRENQRKAS